METIANEDVRVWDNSNIAESYSGVVLPLTCSFARHIYKIAYMAVAKTSGVSSRKIMENIGVFDNLLGFFYGRFYYNMLNWYKMLTLFPGYERNRKNLNIMISAKSKADLNRRYKNNVSVYFKLDYSIRTFIRYIFFESSLKRFKKKVRSYLKEIRQIDFESKRIPQLLSLYREFNRELLGRWSVTLDNDFLAMTFFGALKKFCKKNKLQEERTLSLISEISNVVSARQVEALERLSKQFSKFPELASVDEKQYLVCYKKIQENRKYLRLKGDIQMYVEMYGGRFANELRLETEDLDENPAHLIRLLQLYSSKNEGFEKQELNQKALRDIKLLFYKKIILNYLVKKTKHFLRHREELRLMRSQAFSYARKLFKSIGIRFQEQSIIETANDIFYLELSEILDFMEGKSSSTNFEELVNIRKKQYEEYKKIELPRVFVTHGDPYRSLYEKIMKKKERIEEIKTLKGTGCSPGRIKGKVKILESFVLPRKEKYQIIVTKHTDPGWTPLFGLCEGIIVEHGGLLSHAAIVSRELGLPCVVGVDAVTNILKDGQTVILDGSNGVIQIEH